MKDKILKAIMDGLEAQGIASQTDGGTIWVDDPASKKCFYIGIEECGK